MKKVLTVVGKTTLVLLILILLLLLILLIKAKHDAAVPIIADDYQTTTRTGAALESTFLANGDYPVACYEVPADEILGKYEIYYPDQPDGPLPLIIYCNGSGVKGSDCKPMLYHWASWGFIVAANEETSTWSGEGAEKTLAFVLEESENPSSPLFGRLDTANIGITGHSQGGVAVFNALTQHEHSCLFKAAAVLSPTHEELAQGLGWPYDLAKISVPILMFAGTKGDGEIKTVLPLDAMNSMYDKLNVSKVMGRKADCEHNDTDSAMDGYVTAWFLWQLRGISEAAKVFNGVSELAANPLYQDVRIDLE